MVRMLGTILGTGFAGLGQGLQEGREIARRHAQEAAEDAAHAASLSEFMGKDPAFLKYQLENMAKVHNPAMSLTDADQKSMAAAKGAFAPTNAPATDPAAAPTPGGSPFAPGSGFPAGPVGPESLPGAIPMGGMAKPSPSMSVAPTPSAPGEIPSKVASGQRIPSLNPGTGNEPVSIRPREVMPTVGAAPQAIASPMAPHMTVFNGHIEQMGRLQNGLQQAMKQIPYPQGTPEYNRAAAMIYRTKSKEIEGWQGQLMQDVSSAAQTRGSVVLSRALSMARQGNTDGAADMLNANGVNGEIFRGARFDGNSLVMPDGKTRIEMPELMVNSGILSPEKGMEYSARLHQYDMAYAARTESAKTTAEGRLAIGKLRWDHGGATDRMAQLRLQGHEVDARSRQVVASLYQNGAMARVTARVGNREQQMQNLYELFAQKMDDNDAYVAAYDHVYGGEKIAIQGMKNEQADKNNTSKETQAQIRATPSGGAKKKPGAPAPKAAPAKATPSPTSVTTNKGTFEEGPAPTPKKVSDHKYGTRFGEFSPATPPPPLTAAEIERQQEERGRQAARG